MIIIGLMFFQQMSGISAVIFYTTKIFKDAGSNLDESICTTIVGIVNLLSTFITAFTIDRLGRKILFYTFPAYLYIEPYKWVPLVSIVLYMVGFSLGFGPIPWLMMGEIIPAKIRGPAVSISTAFAWLCTFIPLYPFSGLFTPFGCLGYRIELCCSPFFLCRKLKDKVWTKSKIGINSTHR
ncbi:hypothetical protein NQ317_000758 [Molorchus minor]|uniref:Major facilitator superfamily (MFS) profile domain-containing protein n=1 Tax=Molorchus minor TaxID=1323400 RepID=A0ABQ9J5X2_9CUCU|nr:hypothetical protein NQ317_000758 [Molorchus minor]